MENGNKKVNERAELNSVHTDRESQSLTEKACQAYCGDHNQRETVSQDTVMLFIRKNIIWTIQVLLRLSLA